MITLDEVIQRYINGERDFSNLEICRYNSSVTVDVMKDVTFKNSRITNVFFSFSFTNVSFENCIFKDVSFIGSHLNNVNMFNAYCESVIFMAILALNSSCIRSIYKNATRYTFIKRTDGWWVRMGNYWGHVLDEHSDVFNLLVQVEEDNSI